MRLTGAYRSLPRPSSTIKPSHPPNGVNFHLCIGFINIRAEDSYTSNLSHSHARGTNTHSSYACFNLLHMFCMNMNFYFEKLISKYFLIVIEHFCSQFLFLWFGNFQSFYQKYFSIFLNWIFANCFWLKSKVDSSGFEPETPDLQGRCSTGLSYEPSLCECDYPIFFNWIFCFVKIKYELESKTQFRLWILFFQK